MEIPQNKTLLKYKFHSLKIRFNINSTFHSSAKQKFYRSNFKTVKILASVCASVPLRIIFEDTTGLTKNDLDVFKLQINFESIDFKGIIVHNLVNWSICNRRQIKLQISLIKTD